MPKDLAIIATPPGGIITQIGSDYARGVWVEDASWEHSLVDHGALRAQFTLRRRPEQEWPDLQPFTPIQIMKAGSVAWTGRVQETPTVRGMENQITVQCEGWPMHLKDDALQKVFVHNDVTAWRDTRTMGGTMATFLATGNVNTTDGQITFAVPAGLSLNGCVGVTFDAGPFNLISSLTCTYLGGGIANMELRCASEVSPGSQDEVVVIDATPIATGSTTFSTNFVTSRRYVTVYIIAVVGNIAASNAGWCNLTNLILYSSSSYRSGNASVLKASDVVAATLPYAPKISTSTANISTTSFSIPHFSGPMVNPQDVIDAANAYHLFQSYLLDDAAGGPPVLNYRAIPTSPTLVANVGGAAIVFEDASRNDGGDIYNRVVVDYTDAAGNSALEERTMSGVGTAIADPDIVFDTVSASQVPNPSFDVNTASWNVSGTLTRDTVVFDTTPASGRLTSTPGGLAFMSSVAPTTPMIPGRTYQFRYRVRASAAWLGGTMNVTVTDDATLTNIATSSDSFTNAIGTSFTTRTINFTVRSGGLARLTIQGTGLTASADIIYLDTVQILEARPTIVDRQNFTRTRVLATSSRLTAAAADQIGDIFLQAHRFTPLRGTLTVQGAALRVMQGDVPIPAHLIYRRLGDAILINETDPDLGIIGRVGNISNVAYDESTDTAVVAIDNRKDFIDALLARLAVFTGVS